MTNPISIAIYAFGGLMLFALAIGFFAAPVDGATPALRDNCARDLVVAVDRLQRGNSW